MPQSHWQYTPAPHDQAAQGGASQVIAVPTQTTILKVTERHTKTTFTVTPPRRR